MKLGFTGTQSGMTDFQKVKVVKLIIELKPEEFHHGDCIGSDDQAANIAAKEGIRIVGHPPKDQKKRAFNEFTAEWFPQRPYLERNHNIVDVTDELIATPKEDVEQIRSGTWSTIRYATARGKKIYLILPDGKIEVIDKKSTEFWDED